MAKIKINPLEQKAKLLEQMKDLETKLAEFDKQRADKIGSLAKKFRLVDLADDILEHEFKTIREKYSLAKSPSSAHLDQTQKKSQPEKIA